MHGRKWRAANPEKQAALTARAEAKKRAKNPNHSADQGRLFRQRHPELARANTRAYAKRNPHVGRAIFKRYQARKLKAMPVWANEFLILEAYELAQHRNKTCAGGRTDWSVDHIVPLQGATVCGLHVHNNLRVIPGVLNSIKGNRWWPDGWKEPPIKL